MKGMGAAARNRDRVGSNGTADGSGQKNSKNTPTRTVAKDANVPASVLSMRQTRSEVQPGSVSVEDKVKRDGVPQSVYLNYVKSELDGESHCMELPLTMLLLISFSVAAMSMLNQEVVFAVEESVKGDIEQNANFAFAFAYGHKGIHDVNSYADFWSWMRLGLLPLVVMPSWTYSEGYADAAVMPNGTLIAEPPPAKWSTVGSEQPVPILGDYLHYSRVVGGLRMTQEVAESSYELCRFPTSVDRSAMEAWWGKPCSMSASGELEPLVGEMEVFDRSVRTQWLLPMLDPMETLVNTLVDMEAGCHFATTTSQDPATACLCTWCSAQDPPQPWVDELTSRIEVAFVLYNAHYGLYSYAAANLFVNRGGYIYKAVHVMSAWADPSTDSVSYSITLIAQLTWLVAILKVGLSELFEVISVVRHRPSGERIWHAVKTDYLGPWNMIDWISVLVGVLLVTLYMQMRSSVGEVNEMLSKMMEVSSTTDRAAYVAANEHFFSLVEVMNVQEKYLRLSLCIYPTIVMLRLFKSFAAQPRLALVTATLVRAAPDILHFAIVFLSVYVCMTVNSILFFGQDLEDFSTLTRAWHTCFLAMFGIWDWSKMSEIGFSKACTWFWMFIILMVLVLLNMLLAIIMDAYSFEKDKAKDLQSLAEQVKAMWRRWRQYRAKKRVRLNDIMDSFVKEANGDRRTMMKSDRIITPDFLIENVPRIAELQATRNLLMAANHKTAIDNRSITGEDMKSKIEIDLKHVEERQKEIELNANYVSDAMRFFDRLHMHGDPEYERLFGAHAGDRDDDRVQDVPGVINAMSNEIGRSFVDNMAKIEAWQDNFEQRQNELHDLIAEMQLMVTQQVRSVSAISDMVSQMANPLGNSKVVVVS